MKFTLSWLKDHLATTASLDEIVNKLICLGLEVDAIENPADKLKGFIVGYVESAEQHPDADRLRLCKVNTGSNELVQVVCGAPNARAGMKVAFAPIGTLIPATGSVLKKGKIRGVESFGMMCSADELQLGEESDGILDLDVSDQPGTPLAEAMQLNDPVIDIELTPNRADCFSIRGIARDLAAAGLGTLKEINCHKINNNSDNIITINVEQAADCPMFLGRLVKGINNCSSPEWVQRRLTAIGLRPINALVDITNYICFDLGRPMHVYDADKLQGNIQVRRGKVGETFLALDDKEYTVDDSMIVIADDSGVIGLAGVIGGARTSCDENTKNVLIESALFNPVTVAMTGQKTNIVSDSRTRFERGVDPATTNIGMDLATKLLLDWCGGESQIGPVAEVGELPKTQSTITLKLGKLNAISGASFTIDQASEALTRLGFTVKSTTDTLEVIAPSWRVDMQHDVDLIEEIIRLDGYDNIVATKLPVLNRTKPSVDIREKLRMVLASRGLSEAISFSFLDLKTAKQFITEDKLISLANPISQDLDTMRPNVLPSLIQAVVRNQSRGMTETNLFEVGTQFSKHNGIVEQRVITGIRSGLKSKLHWSTSSDKVDVFDAKADAIAVIREAGFDETSVQVARGAAEYYHPGRSGSIKQGKKTLAYFGQLHPSILKAMKCKTTVVGFEVFIDEIPQRRAKIKPLKLSPYQTVERDFAFVVKQEVESAKLIQAIRSADRNLLTNIDIFDIYQGEPLGKDEKSIAIRVKLEPHSDTLTDDEINAISDKIITAVNKSTGGILRQV